MKTKRLLSCITLLVVGFSLFLVPEQVAHADTGPKPSMKYAFVYDISPALKIVSGILFECSDPTCADATPLRQMGPQGFRCGETSCSSLAYGYSEYHRLSIEFSDGRLRESNVFTKNHFEANYTVHVLDDSLTVKETGGRSRLTADLGFSFLYLFWALMSGYFNLGLPVTLAIELTIGLVYVLWRKRPWLRVLLAILLMNLVTQPVLWFAVKEFRLTTCIFAYLLELVVCLVEAWILYRVLRKTAKFSEVFLLSLAMNLTSFGIGLLLPI
jgi:hypothetical protein